MLLGFGDVAGVLERGFAAVEVPAVFPSARVVPIISSAGVMSFRKTDGKRIILVERDRDRKFVNTRLISKIYVKLAKLDRE